jgi:hypothetical protein
MNIISFDNVIKNPEKYVEDILKQNFQNFDDNGIIFKNVQGRSNDEFENVVLQLFPNYEAKWNFVRKSPLNQQEPTFIHNDAAMSDVTVILYLNKNHPDNDGTTIYDEENKPICAIYAKFNRMIAFESELMHSRNIFENFGEGDSSRLIQVIFLKQKV